MERQRPLPVAYKGVRLDCGWGDDVVVEGKVVIEIVCVNELLAVHGAQLLTYVRLGGLEVGLLVNFRVAVLEGKCQDEFPSVPPCLPAFAAEAAASAE